MKHKLIHTLMAAALLPMAAAADNDKKPQPAKPRILAAKGKEATYLGIAMAPIPQIVREQLDLPAGTGIAIGHVAKGSPAEKAKLQVNDIVTKLDDQLIVNAEQFQTLIKTRKPGDEITLSLRRKGKPQQVKVKLGKGNVAVQLGQRNVPFRWQGGEWQPFFGGGNFDLNDPEAMKNLRQAIEQWQKQWQNVEPGKQPNGIQGFGFGFGVPGGQGQLRILPAPGGRGGINPLPAQPKIPRLPNLPNLPGVKRIQINNSTTSISDNTGTYTLSNQNGKKRFKATDPEGELLFEGDVNDEEDRKAVPKNLHQKLDQLENVKRNQKRFEFKFDLNGLNFDLKGLDGKGRPNIVPRKKTPGLEKGDV